MGWRQERCFRGERGWGAEPKRKAARNASQPATRATVIGRVALNNLRLGAMRIDNWSCDTDLRVIDVCHCNYLRRARWSDRHLTCK
jgi:hypothetical protein